MRLASDRRTIADPVAAVGLLLAGRALAPSPAAAQRPLNLDMERGSLAIPGFVWGWEMSDGGADAPPSVRRDSTVAHGGRWSLRVTRGAAGGGALAALSYLTLPAPRPRAVRLVGWVRTSALAGGTATLRVEQYDGGPQPGPARVDTLGQAGTAGVGGTRGWTRLVVEAPVAPNAQGLGVGVQVAGTAGTAWFDDLALTLDGRPVTRDPDPAATPDAAQRAWLRARSTPLRGVDPALGTGDDPGLDAFGRFVGDARVVSLGEATHGARALFQAKHRLIAYLVERRGFDLVLLEENLAPVDAVNRYVLGGPGDARAVLRGLFRVNQNEQVLALVGWARAYNAAHPGRPVTFAGFDVQDPRMPIDTVLAWLGRAAPAYAAPAGAAYRDFRAALARARYPQVQDSAADRWAAQAGAVRAHLDAARADYLAAARTAADSAAVDLAVRYAAIIHLAARQRMDPASAARRDSAMAATLLWQLERGGGAGPARRAVLWAHNGHVGRHPGAMGEALERLRPGLVRVVATTAATGEYRGTRLAGHVEAMSRGGRLPESVAVPFDPAPPGSVAAVLAADARARRVPALFVDLRDAAAVPAGRWVLDERPFLRAGAEVQDWAYGNSPVAKRYDGLVFVTHTEASAALRP